MIELPPLRQKTLGELVDETLPFSVTGYDPPDEPPPYIPPLTPEQQSMDTVDLEAQGPQPGAMPPLEPRYSTTPSTRGAEEAVRRAQERNIFAPEPYPWGEPRPRGVLPGESALDILGKEDIPLVSGAANVLTKAIPKVTATTPLDDPLATVTNAIPPLSMIPPVVTAATNPLIRAGANLLYNDVIDVGGQAIRQAGTVARELPGEAGMARIDPFASGLTPEEEAAQLGNVQSGMGFGEKSTQGGLFENFAPVEKPPKVTPEELAAKAAREEAERLRGLGQQELPTDVPLGQSEAMLDRRIDALIDAFQDIDDADETGKQVLMDAIEKLGAAKDAARMADQIAEGGLRGGRETTENLLQDLGNLRASPLNDLVNKLRAVFEYHGELPEALTVAQFKKFTGRQVLDSDIQKSGRNKGKIPIHLALDEPADTLGMTTDELQRALDKHWKEIETLRPRNAPHSRRTSVQKAEDEAAARAAKAIAPNARSRELTGKVVEGYGTPPAGTAPARPIEPAPTADGKGFEYSVPRSLVEDGVLPSDTITIPQYYPEQRHLVDLMASRAPTSLEPAEVTIERLRNTPRWSDVDVADAILAEHKLGQRGDLKLLAELVDLHKVRGGLDPGRTVQANAAMKRMSPEGNFQDAIYQLGKELDARAAKGAQKNINKAAQTVQGKAAAQAKQQGDALIAEAEELTKQGNQEAASLRARATKAAKAESDPASAVTPPKTPVAALNRLDKAVRYLENAGRAPGAPQNTDELMAQLARTKKLAQDTGWLMEHPEAKQWLDEVEAVWKLPPEERNAAARGLIQQLVDTHLPTMEARSDTWKEASANLSRIDNAATYLSNQGRAPGMPKVANEWAAAFTKIKRLAQQTGWIMNDTEVKVWLDQADEIVSMGVGKAQVDATKAFIASTRDTLIPHLESLKKTQVELLREARYKEIMTGKLIPEAKQRAANLARDAQNRSQQIVLKNGLALDPDLAASLWERSQNIAKLPPGFQQNREYQRFMNDAKNLLPLDRWDMAADLYGLPIGLKTMWDYGFMMRQGALLGVKHPGRWKEAGEAALKASRDHKYAEQIQTQLASRETANMWHEAGLAFDELWEGNEFFGGGKRIASRIPGYQGSQRSFVVPGNVLRHRGADDVFMGWLPKGYDLGANPINTVADAAAATGKSEKDIRDLAMLYNAATGKSNIEFLKTNKFFLRLPFFAPQWALSGPEFVVRSMFTPEGRKIGGEILAKYVGTVMAIEWMGEKAGVWETEADPRSSRFGQVRIKGTQQYYDPTLGLGGWIKTIAQILPTPGPGQDSWKDLSTYQPHHKTASGNIVPQPWTEALGNFGRGKLHPIPGEFWNWMEGQNIVGEKRVFTGMNTETALSVFNTAKSLFASLTPQDIIEGFIDDGIRGGVLALPNIAGMPGRMYETFGDKQQKVTDGMFPGKQYRELDRADQRKVNDSAEIKLEIEKMKPRDLDMRDVVQDRFDQYERRGKEIELGTPATATRPYEPGLRDYIEAGMSGEKLREEIQAAKNARYQAARALLTEDVIAYSTQNKQLKLHDAFAQQWLNAPLEKDVVTGDLNFKKRDAERAKILLAAQDALKAAGRDSSYITGTGPDSFRATAWKDPIVAKKMAEYEADQETLRPYWELEETLAETMPNIQKMRDREQGFKDAGDDRRAKIMRRNINEYMEGHKHRYAQAHPEVAKALVKWGYSDSKLMNALAAR